MRPSTPFDAGADQARKADRDRRPDHGAPRRQRAHASAQRDQRRNLGQVADRPLAGRRNAAARRHAAGRGHIDRQGRRERRHAASGGGRSRPAIRPSSKPTATFVSSAARQLFRSRSSCARKQDPGGRGDAPGGGCGARATGSTASSRSITSACRSTSSCSRPVRSTTRIRPRAGLRRARQRAALRADARRRAGPLRRGGRRRGRAGSLTFADRLAALEAALVDLPRPAIPGRVEVSLPAVVAGDTTIRDVRLSAEPADGGWTLKSFAATLPGRTTLEAGRQAQDGWRVRLRRLHCCSPSRQPSGFAAWLARDVDDAIRRLPAAGFQARVEPDGRAAELQRARTGAGRRHVPGQGRQPAAGRRQAGHAHRAFEGGALDVDGLAAFASLFVSDEGASRFADHDLDLEVKAGPVSVGRTDRRDGRHVAAAARRPAGDRPAVDRRPGRGDDQRYRHDRGFPGQARRRYRCLGRGGRPGAADRGRRRALPRQCCSPGSSAARAAAHPGLFEDARVDVVATRGGQ